MGCLGGFGDTIFVIGFGVCVGTDLLNGKVNDWQVGK